MVGQRHLVSLWFEDLVGLSVTMKIRISHFITKNIEIKETNSTSRVLHTKSQLKPLSPKIVQKKLNKKRVKQNQTKISKKPATGLKLERIVLKRESDYAGVPKREESEIINKIIDREVADFIKNK